MARAATHDPAELALVGEAMRDAMGALKSHIERHLGESNATLAQGFTLRVLAKKGRMTLGELADALSVTQPNVTGVVDRLERDGLAFRSRSSEDKRVMYVRLTEAGLAKAKEMETAMREAFVEVLGGLRPAEVTAFREVLVRIKERADELARE